MNNFDKGPTSTAPELDDDSNKSNEELVQELENVNGEQESGQEVREEISDTDNPEKDVEKIKDLYNQQMHLEKQVRSNEEVLQRYDLQIQQETDSDKKAQLEQDRNDLAQENEENRDTLQKVNDDLADVGE